MQIMRKLQALQKLDEHDLVQQLPRVPLWSHDPQLGCINREFTLPNFSEAFEFMTQIAHEAEKHQHHPEWRNVYNKIWLTWTTHDVNGLSMKDIQMALICDELFLNQSRTD
jgi:4a-hydroxytetrahydrobiopterin dehydratase